MSSALKIITPALRKIGVQSPLKPASPESIDEALQELVSMMEKWVTIGYETGINQIESTSDELNEPADLKNIIIDNLACEIAPLYSFSVSAQLLSKAADGMTFLEKYYRKVVVLNKNISSTAPRGAGNTRGLKPRIFFKNDAVLEESSTLDTESTN